MGRMTEEQIAVSRRAEERARAVLKPGDRLRVRLCGGLKSSVVMTGWDGRWITSATRDDIAASHIYAVNGEPVDFTLA